MLYVLLFTVMWYMFSLILIWWDDIVILKFNSEYTAEVATFRKYMFIIFSDLERKKVRIKIMFTWTTLINSSYFLKFLTVLYTINY